MSQLDRDLVVVDPRGFEVPADWGTLRSPETYLRFGRASGFASPHGERYDKPYRYPVPPRLSLNEWAPSGTWTLAHHAAVLNEPGGRIAFRFQARDVHLVMGPASLGSPVPFRVLLDGQGPGVDHGGDVDVEGNGILAAQRLYQLVRQAGRVEERLIEIEFREAGAEAYCFTFG